jgi:hypothetical protein
MRMALPFSGSPCCAQLGKNQPQPIGVLRLYPGLAASFEESLQPLVPESTDHEKQCNLVGYGLQEGERDRSADRAGGRSPTLRGRSAQHYEIRQEDPATTPWTAWRTTKDKPKRNLLAPSVA